MKHLFSKILILSISLFLIISTTNCGGREKKDDKRIAHTVAVITVEQKTVSRSVDLFGLVYGEQQVMVTPKIMGKVVRIVNPEGSKVNEGDTILYILNDMPGMDYQPGPVLAPIAGTVGKIYVDIGQTAAPTMPVALLASFSENVKVKAPISDLDLSYVKRGAVAMISVSAIPNGDFEGKVTGISSVLDPVSGSATVEITIPNSDKRLIPGMACSINLLLERKTDVVALPLVALFTDGFSKVLVVDDENIAHARQISVGLVGNELAEIKFGLSPGERVITIGKERVSDGDKVTVIEVK
ncbi:MAG: efflux RND transporter periplasmic adaptor subunit [Candidatus Latescibacteria bacterium]|nr:efflux RND transporter periplasmic adaptor subunit [Candidatus Latescibacterota bacterium]